MKRESRKCAIYPRPLHQSMRRLSQEAIDNGDAPPLADGDGGYADWVIVLIHGLREYLDHQYRRLLDVRTEMHGIVADLGLTVDELRAFTTVGTRTQELVTAVWRELLRESAALHDTGDVQATDSTSIAHRSSSYNYARRVEDTFESVKPTVILDCDSGAILEVNCSMSLPHDTQIAWQLPTRNLDQLETVGGNKGFDWDTLRHTLRDEGVRPVIKHREFYSLDAAHNARIDDAPYHRRSIAEAQFFALRKRSGSTLRARTWFGQFHELALKAGVRNIERSLST